MLETVQFELFPIRIRTGKSKGLVINYKCFNKYIAPIHIFSYIVHIVFQSWFFKNLPSCDLFRQILHLWMLFICFQYPNLYNWKSLFFIYWEQVNLANKRDSYMITCEIKKGKKLNKKTNIHSKQVQILTT